VVTRQLAEWGDDRAAAERTQRRVARPVERDLENVLVDLADDFPMLASLVEQRLGGQRKLPIGRPGSASDASAFLAASLGGVAEVRATAATTEHPQEDKGGGPAPPATDGSPSPPVSPETAASQLPSAAGPKRPARYGLMVQFEARAKDSELARLVDTVVWVNEAHPAYRRAVASRSEGYHLALSVALALAPLAAEPAGQHDFVTGFLSRWGEALEKPRTFRRADGRSKGSPA